MHRIYYSHARRKLDEKLVPRKLDIPDFQHITKDRVIALETGSERNTQLFGRG